MNIIDKFGDFVEQLNTKDFYKYIGSTIAVILLIFIFIIYRFFGSINHYKKELRIINTQREEMQELLEKAKRIKEQKQAINTMLEADPDFRIGGYFRKVLEQLNLTNKAEKSNDVTTQERTEQGYNESILSVKLIDMNMKELTELLDVLEQNKRIYSKELDIQRSKKAPGTLEVQLTIATLQPRSQPTEYTE